MDTMKAKRKYENNQFHPNFVIFFFYLFLNASEIGAKNIKISFFMLEDIVESRLKSGEMSKGHHRNRTQANFRLAK